MRENSNASDEEHPDAITRVNCAAASKYYNRVKISRSTTILGVYAYQAEGLSKQPVHLLHETLTNSTMAGAQIR